jgi:Na+-transporting methylmalonyl-CoA/oxaloacetate decarboxylase gamma subunit
MYENITLSLVITLIGMGLVFALILIIWGMMSLLVRIGSSRIAVESEAQRSEDSDTESIYQAAATAVAVAIASQTDIEPHEFPLPPTALVSAWQAVMRSNIHKKRGLYR